MKLDISTLIFAGGLMALASGLFLLMHWWQAREDRAALSWGLASCARGVGITLMALPGGAPGDALPTIVGALILTIGAAEFWATARIFRRGSVRRGPQILALATLIAAVMAVGATGRGPLAAELDLCGCAAFHAAAAVEFWRVGAERPRGLRLMIFLLGLQGTALIVSAVDLGMSNRFSPDPELNWWSVIHLVGCIFAAGTAFALVTMLKDRSESKHKAAALTDPLTGLANRRAITAFVERMFDKCKTDGAPISVLAFDLDNFKKINDTFGHPTGDHVLRIFADVLSSAVGKNEMAGRMGGEEFALALPGRDIDAALAVAKRVRVAFQDDARFVDGRSLDATVSVGVATAPDHATSVADIFASADIALYRAKKLGRNRVVLSVRTPSDAQKSVVKRIA